MNETEVILASHNTRFSSSDYKTKTVVDLDKGLGSGDPDLLRKRFLELRIWRSRGRRAPHKPLLVLWALGRCLRGENRLVSFKEAEPKLRQLLKKFGPPRKSLHPELPFWHLRNDQVWQIPDEEKIAERKGGGVKLSSLRKQNAHGGFTREAYALLKNRNFALEIAHTLLDAHFPPSLHDEILQAVGISVQTDDGWVTVKRRLRDSRFSGNVLEAYDYRCAVCSHAVHINKQFVALDAAHIKWHSAKGPDQVPNGLALCSLHHRLFDGGAFTLCEDRKVKVSKLASGEHIQESLSQFDGQRIWLPEQHSKYPALKYLKWHHSEVFKRFESMRV